MSISSEVIQAELESKPPEGQGLGPGKKQAPRLRTISELDLKGKTVFIRLDLNVPLSDPDDNGRRTVEDDNRIREALPTVQYAVEQGAKVLLTSHLGRPKGRRVSELSLEPVAFHMADLLGQEVMLADDCIGEGIELMAQKLPDGQILMLENPRFHKEEEANDAKFCQRLAKLCDVYVNDAFGAAHRKHATTYGLPALMNEKAVGLLVEKELKYLNTLLENPPRPFYTLLGGAKVGDKIQSIRSLMKRIDGLLVGGAMAYAFSAAKGEAVPADALQPAIDDIEAAKAILKEAKARNLPVKLPVDSVDCFDIGPETVKEFSELLRSAKAVFWNGPVGWFEKEQYAHATFALAETLASLDDCMKVVGGGDTVAAVNRSGFAEKYDHLSTGGGAVLEYLEGNGLPGIDILVSEEQVQNRVLQ